MSSVFHLKLSSCCWLLASGNHKHNASPHVPVYFLHLVFVVDYRKVTTELRHLNISVWFNIGCLVLSIECMSPYVSVKADVDREGSVSWHGERRRAVLYGATGYASCSFEYTSHMTNSCPGWDHWLEHLICNSRVRGSSPVESGKFSSW